MKSRNFASSRVRDSCARSRSPISCAERLERPLELDGAVAQARRQNPFRVRSSSLAWRSSREESSSDRSSRTRSLSDRR